MENGKKRIICNPYLPGKEYVPDGEPYIFGDRIYIYGSHDEFGSDNYCTGCYVGWSAPIEDPGNWTYEGVILEKGLDPLDLHKDKNYFAPDVTQGPDGRFYLYYSIENSNIISVAVCEEPMGKYHFYGHVKDEKGVVLGAGKSDAFQFDPAVLVDDDGRIYLYSGQGTPVKEQSGHPVLGAQVCELQQDMLTMLTPQKVITSRTENPFEENPFFEASSIRKYDGIYYFIYSPIPNVHNLCYAVSRYPDREFRYQGVLISNADIQDGEEQPVERYYSGNNHGSILRIEDEFYIFYHRHTNLSGWCRQGCAEKLIQKEDGYFLQAQMTSQGLSGAPFEQKNEYPAYMACHLWGKNRKIFTPFAFPKYHDTDSYITEEAQTEIPYIANMSEGATAVYRYFRLGDVQRIGITARKSGKVQESQTGYVEIADTQGKYITRIAVTAGEKWEEFTAVCEMIAEETELQMQYHGSGAIDILYFRLS